jgi:hypothetical protein
MYSLAIWLVAGVVSAESLAYATNSAWVKISPGFDVRSSSIRCSMGLSLRA